MLVGALALIACAPDPEIGRASVQLRLPGAASCAPEGVVDRVVVEALGDFPALGTSIEILRPSAEGARLDRFPVDTRALAFSASTARWEGAGAVVLSEDTESVVLLPEGRECALADPALAHVGATLVPRPEGGVFFVGGERDGEGLRRLLLLREGELLAETLAPMAQRRLGSGAVIVGERLVVAGGAPGISGPGHDRYEVFDLAGNAMGSGVLPEASRDAALVAVGGEAFVVGGRASDEASARASVYAIDPLNFRVREANPLPVARSGLVSLTTSEGVPVVLGGVAETGARVGDVFAYDLREETWVAQQEVRLPPLEHVVGAALPGGGVALWADAMAGRDSRLIRLLRRTSGELSTIAFSSSDVLLGEEASGLRDVAALALADGRLALNGLRDDAPVALVADLGRGSLDVLEAREPASVLFRRLDGSLFATGPRGASLRRVVMRTAFDQPPATLIAADFALTGAWEEEGATLRALSDGAQASLPTYRFADFTASFTATGLLELRLTRAGDEPLRIRIGPSSAGPALCELPRRDGGSLTLERTGTRLVLRADGDSRACELPELVGSVGFRVSAAAGGSLSQFAVQRR